MDKERAAQEGRTLATVAYLTFVGTIIAFFLNDDKKNPFVLFHLRQMFGLIILLFIANMFFKVNETIYNILWLISFSGWAYGLFGAVTKKWLAIPFIGEKFQQWFQFIK